jgi:hypothetical protein
MKLVLCEGADEIAVLTELCTARGIAGLTVEEYKGRDNLAHVLRDVPKRPDYVQQQIESLAVLLDANGDPDASWQRLRDAVQHRLNVALSGRGVFAGEKPKITGYLIGRSDGKGMLEDLCLLAINEQAGLDCLDTYFRCLVEKTEKKEYHAKARFRAWMSAQEDREMRLGQAASKGHLRWDSPAFDPLVAFLRTL